VQLARRAGEVPGLHAPQHPGDIDVRRAVTHACRVFAALALCGDQRRVFRRDRVIVAGCGTAVRGLDDLDELPRELAPVVFLFAAIPAIQRTQHHVRRAYA